MFIRDCSFPFLLHFRKANLLVHYDEEKKKKAKRAKGIISERRQDRDEITNDNSMRRSWLVGPPGERLMGLISRIGPNNWFGRKDTCRRLTTLLCFFCFLSHHHRLSTPPAWSSSTDGRLGLLLRGPWNWDLLVYYSLGTACRLYRT